MGGPKPKIEKYGVRNQCAVKCSQLSLPLSASRYLPGEVESAEEPVYFHNSRLAGSFIHSVQRFAHGQNKSGHKFIIYPLDIYSFNKKGLGS